MIIHKAGKRRRWGAAAVETALVLIPLFMFIFGIFEFGRFLMDWNVFNNATREGCRYALVNNTSTSINSDVQAIVTKYMAGRSSSFTNFTVSVSGTHQGANTAVNNLAAGDLVTVTVSGKYKFLNVIPFVPMPTITMSSAVTMVCEGAT